MIRPGTPEVVPTKSIDERVAVQVRAFLRRFCVIYFPEPTNRHGINQSAAAQKLKVSQGYISDLLDDQKQKKPGLSLILRLRELTGASFEEITGTRPPLHPRYPLSHLGPDRTVAEQAALEASSRAHDRPSSIERSATPGKQPKDR